MAQLPSVLRRQLSVKTIDDFPIAVTRFEPPVSERKQAVVVIGNATGVHARLYHDFACWLAAQGVSTYTFDYRYTGLSFPPPYDAQSFTEQERKAAMRACPDEVDLTTVWAKKDFAIVVRYASDENPGVPLTILSNSLGAHLMTLFPKEWPSITRFLSVCGGNAHWRNIRNAKATRHALQMQMKPELETSRLFPSSWLGLGREMPYGPGNEWLQWAEHPHFALHKKEDADNVRKLMGKQFLYIGFADDDTLTKQMMPTQMGLYGHADRLKHSLWIDPAKQNPPWPPCRHVESFVKTRIPHVVPSVPGEPPHPTPATKTREETIWKMYLAYILTGHIDTTAGEYKCWTPEDERDLDAERAEHEHRKEQEQSKRWKSWLPWVKARPQL